MKLARSFYIFDKYRIRVSAPSEGKVKKNICASIVFLQFSCNGKQFFFSECLLQCFSLLMHVIKLALNWILGKTNIMLKYRNDFFQIQYQTSAVLPIRFGDCYFHK